MPDPTPRHDRNRHTRRRLADPGASEAAIHLRIQRMQAFCAAFPVLRGAPGTAPWDPVALDAWAVGPASNALGRSIAAFVLALWCGSRDAYWRVERFDILKAAVEWDEAHRRVFTDWLAKPWWP